MRRKKGEAVPAEDRLKLAEMEPTELLKLIKKAGGQRQFSRKHGVPRTTIQYHLNKMKLDPYQHRPAPEAVHRGTGEGIERWIISSAQDMTKVHEGFLANLEAYCDWLKEDGACELLIPGFTYSKKLFTEHDPGQSWFHERVRPYLIEERIRIADKIDVCGEMNTRPTAEQPLSGLDTYTRERWGIFPHAKVQLKSIATMKSAPAKMIMTTGCCTMPNYLPMKAGMKASFHHVFGAVLVEVHPDGTFFCRHLLGEEDTGAFYDLDRKIENGVVTENVPVKCLTPGDIHCFQIDPEVSRTLFGMWPTQERTAAGRIWASTGPTDEMSMIEDLQPEHLFAHDILDFKVRNHHSRSDPHDRFKLFLAGTESVEDELREVALFLDKLAAKRFDMTINVVDSNHDQALLRWVKEASHKEDPVNAIFLLESQLAVYKAMARDDHAFSIFEHVIKNSFPWKCEGVRFLPEDKSYKIGGVEHSMHGHRGLNGARGSTQSFTKLESKATVGHQHTCSILDGVYVAGTSSKMDLGYNSGPSSWSHSTVVQYANGKRAMITIMNGKYRL